MVTAKGAAVRIVLFGLVTGGCAHGDRGGSVCCPRPEDLPVEVVLPEVPRGTISPDLRALAPFAKLDNVLKAEAELAITYRRLLPQECQCMAAKASPVGNLLDRKAADTLEQTPSHPWKHDVDSLAAVKHGILKDSAAEARNQAAGKALELYFQLAEAEARRDLLKRSVKELDDALANGERMRSQGMMLGDEFDALYRQRVETLADGVELQLGIERLNGELQHMIKAGPAGGSWRIWPDAPWAVTDEPIDAGAAVAVGMAHRPELIMLRRVSSSLNDSTAPAVRSLLGRVDGLLGMADGGKMGPLKVLAVVSGKAQASPEEVESLCRQIQAYRIERERTTAEEIRLNALAVQARVRQVALGRQEVINWQSRLDELKARAAKGVGEFTATTGAQLRLLRAQSSLVGQVMAWNIARAKLAQAQGILAEQCGFPVSCPAAAPPG